MGTSRCAQGQLHNFKKKLESLFACFLGNVLGVWKICSRLDPADPAGAKLFRLRRRLMLTRERREIAIYDQCLDTNSMTIEVTKRNVEISERTSIFKYVNYN